MANNTTFTGLKKTNEAVEAVVVAKQMDDMLYSPMMTSKTVSLIKSAQKQHKKWAARTMQGLYAFYPVYRKFEVDKDGNVTMKYTIGGNTPIMKEVGGVEEKADRIIMSSETGYEYPIDTGKDERYGKINDVISLSSKRNSAFIKDAIENGVYVLDNEIVESGTEGAVKFKIFIWSNSNERNVEALFINAEKYPGNAAMDLIDKVSGGSFAHKLSVSSEMKFKHFAKLGARLGIMHTPAVDSMVNAKRIVFVDGDLAGTNDMALESEYIKVNNIDGSLSEFLASKGIENDMNTYDGAVYISISYLARCFKEMGLNMPEWMVRLIAVQNRSEGLMSKVFGEAARQEELNGIRDYAYKLLAQGKVNAIHEIGDVTAPIDIVIDTNGAKLANMDRIMDPNCDGFRMFILNVAKASVTGLSGQMIEKFMAIDMDTTTSFVKGLSYNKADEELVKKFEGGLQLGLDKKIGTVELVGDLVQNLITVNPDRALQDNALMTKLTKDATKWQDAAVRSGSVKADTLYHHVLFDTTKMITGGAIEYILGFDKELSAVQAFSNDVIVKNADKIAEIESNKTLSKKEKKQALDKIMTAVIIKYPTPGKEEFEVVRYLTKQEVLDLINIAMLKVSVTMSDDKVKSLTKLLRRYFFETSFGVVKLAPLNILKNKLAGMDTDYDAIASIFESVLVEMAVNKVKAQGNNGAVAYISYNNEDKLDIPDTTPEVKWEAEEEATF